MFKTKDLKVMLVGILAVIVVSSIFGFACCGTLSGVVILASGIALAAIFIIYTKKRYSDIEQLNIYLEKVLAGDETPGILDQEEGELSVLKNNVYKATTTLKYQQELLLGDKKRMADAIADISHQLKTPLTSMMVMNDLLKTEEDSEKRKAFLKTMSEQLDRMNWLIQTLLKLSKLDTGTISMREEMTSADELVLAAKKPFEIQIDLKDIKYSYAPQLMTIRCDRNWTIEAVQNIIKNCLEHMDCGGELKILVEETNLFNQIIISDTGCGISNDDLPHIFERFYKGKNAGKDSVGIGLALAKAIMQNQHGDILVKSTEGEGTTFYIRFYKTII